MRVVFAGTPDFAVPSLAALLAAGHDVAAVLSQPDRPAGRGRRRMPGPVTARARELGLVVLQPESLRDDFITATLRELEARLMVVVAYGLMLPPAVLALPRDGCINVHASLLPRWRGAAPIQRAIEAGDRETGVTIMRMTRGLDRGPMLARRTVPIGPTTTAGELHDRLAALGARLLVDTLGVLERGALAPEAQDERLATYAAKLEPADAKVDWRRPAVEIARLLRAMNPWPVARSRCAGQTLRLWQAEAHDGAGPPGEVLRVGRDGIDVACGTGVLRLTVLQRQGGRRLPAAEFLNGFPVRPGERFESRWRGPAGV